MLILIAMIIYQNENKITLQFMIFWHWSFIVEAVCIIILIILGIIYFLGDKK
jgi:hypothetical protein